MRLERVHWTIAQLEVATGMLIEVSATLQARVVTDGVSASNIPSQPATGSVVSPRDLGLTFEEWSTRGLPSSSQIEGMYADAAAEEFSAMEHAEQSRLADRSPSVGSGKSRDLSGL